MRLMTTRLTKTGLIMIRPATVMKIAVLRSHRDAAETDRASHYLRPCNRSSDLDTLDMARLLLII